MGVRRVELFVVLSGPYDRGERSSIYRMGNLEQSAAVGVAGLRWHTSLQVRCRLMTASSVEFPMVLGCNRCVPTVNVASFEEITPTAGPRTTHACVGPRIVAAHDAGRAEVVQSATAKRLAPRIVCLSSRPMSLGHKMCQPKVSFDFDCLLDNKTVLCGFFLASSTPLCCVSEATRLSVSQV